LFKKSSSKLWNYFDILKIIFHQKGAFMDGEFIYSLVGFILFMGIVVLIFRDTTPKEVRTKAKKKAEILQKYNEQLSEALAPFARDREAFVAKKSALLKKISQELSQNIFFDEDEIRNIILELSLEN